MHIIFEQGIDKIANPCYCINVMQYIKHKIENKYYTYVPGEFLPILRDGELANRREFHQYKLARARWRIGRHLQLARQVLQ